MAFREEILMDITWDTEANNLLNDKTVDYRASPYKLKKSFKMHCIVVEVHETGEFIAFYEGDTYELDGRAYKEKDASTGSIHVLENYDPVEYTHKPLSEFKNWVKRSSIKRVVAQNSINYDHLVTKLYFDMDYTIEPDTWDGKPVEIYDTMVMSKVLNPDRFGGHSLDNLGKKVGLNKIEFRKHLPDNERFEFFAADMLYYCIRDVKVNTLVYKMLEKDRQGWDWEEAISLEKSVAELVTRGEHRGFCFDVELAGKSVKDLDILMEERRVRVEPLLPPKPATKGYMKDFTAPKKQFLKTGEPNSYLVKFAAKIEGEIVGEVLNYKLKFQGNLYDLPLDQEPLVKEMTATIDDSTWIKEWLVSLGWVPSEWKEKDLTVNSKKVKLEGVKYDESVQRYVDQTLASNFGKERMEHLKVTKSQLKRKLISHDLTRPLKVVTNPNFTKGQDKEMCPNLEKLFDEFPYAKDVVEYLTFKHRRNSILGGGLDWDGEEEAEKGYMASVRSDGRIPTPAGTCDAATSRFKHKIVANIPRVTSLYGDKMRSLFGVDRDRYFQMGYDFDSLEAKVESHYTYNYVGGKKYGESLTAAKPNDCHTVLAGKITEQLGYKFPRGSAKAVKYGCSYNAQPPRVAKTIGCSLQDAKIIFDMFWQEASCLNKLKENMQKYWETTGKKKFLLGIDGRKLPVRSKGNVINTAFQSCGVICAKKAMVLHDKKLKAAGISVDFFRDDWKNLSYCAQLIGYHDEAQLEVTKDLVKFKIYKTKEECEAFKAKVEKEEGDAWGDVMETSDGRWFTSYSLAGKLAADAVKESGEYYKLNVELTAGYMFGYNWKDCH